MEVLLHNKFFTNGSKILLQSTNDRIISLFKNEAMFKLTNEILSTQKDINLMMRKVFNINTIESAINSKNCVMNVQMQNNIATFKITSFTKSYETKYNIDLSSDINIYHTFDKVINEFESQSNCKTTYNDLTSKTVSSLLYTPTLMNTEYLIKDFPFYNDLIISGSFNPLHEGHISMGDFGCEWCRRNKIKYNDLVYELSIFNVDKPPLDENVCKLRLSQFETSKLNVVLTTSPKFIEKVSLFQSCMFLIGGDTAIRLFDKKYYNENDVELANAIDIIKKSNSKFLVFPRKDVKSNNIWDEKSIKPLLPESCFNLFHFISQSEYFNTISSTELRNKGIKI